MWTRAFKPKETRVIKLNGKSLTFRIDHDLSFAGPTWPKVSVRAMKDEDEARAIRAFYEPMFQWSNFSVEPAQKDFSAVSKYKRSLPADERRLYSLKFPREDNYMVT